MNQTTKTVTNDGLRLISHYMPDTQAVSLNIFVHTGSRFEDKETSGIAHFFEHMVFKGTPKRPSPYQISYELESIGAEVNAATSQEYTVYYIKVLKQNIEKGFDILSDAFLHSSIIEEEVDKEREVIKEEIKMYEDDPSSFADDELMENLYPQDQYGRNIAGRIDDLDNIKSEQIKEFVKKNYFYENTVIVGTGNITHEELVKLVEKYFTDYQHGEDYEPDYIENHYIDKYKIYNKDIQQAQLRMATYSVPYFSNNKYKISVAMDILGTGMGSKLFIEVREKRGLAYNIYSYDKHWSKSGYIVLGAGLMAERIDETQKICMDEIEKMAIGGFSEADLNRAKELSRSSILMNMDTVDSWAWFLGKRECVYGEMTSIDEIIKSIEEVTYDDIKTVMEDLNQREWHTTIVRG